MKRILPFLLILALILVQLPSLLPVKAHAAEFDNNFCYDVLDYDTNPRHAASPSAHVEYKLAVSTMIVNDIDIIIYTLAGVSSAYVSAGYASWNLKITNIGNGYYRLYGSAGGSGFSKLYLGVTLSFNSYFQVLKFNLYTSSNYFIETNATASLGVPSSTYSFSYSPGSTSASKSLTYASSQVYDSEYTLFVEFPKWANFDYLDVQLYIVADSINSIGAFYGSANIPISISYLDNSSSVSNSYYVNVRLDVRGLTGSDVPNLVVVGQLINASAAVNTFSILSCGGVIDVDNVNPLFYYTLMIKAYLSEQNLVIDQAAEDIIAAIGGVFSSSGEGEVVKDKGTQIGGEISAGQAQLDSVDKPSGGDITAIDSLGAVGFTGNTTYLTQIVNTPYIKDVFVFVAILAVVSLVLFGSKKGG